MDPDSIVCPELYPPFEIIPREAGSIDLSRASNGVSSRHRQGISMPRNQDLSSLPCARRREFSTTFHDDPVSRPGNILIPIGVGTKGLERERDDRHVSGLKPLVNKFVASDRRIFHGSCK